MLSHRLPCAMVCAISALSGRFVRSISWDIMHVRSELTEKGVLPTCAEMGVQQWLGYE